MAEVDPVILELIARDGAYRSRLLATADTADRAFNRQRIGVQNLERQMQRSTGSIASSFKTMASSLAVAFSAREVQQLADG